MVQIGAPTDTYRPLPLVGEGWGEGPTPAASPRQQKNATVLAYGGVLRGGGSQAAGRSLSACTSEHTERRQAIKGMPSARASSR